MLVNLCYVEQPPLSAYGFAGQRNMSEPAQQKAGEGLISALARGHGKPRLFEHLVLARPPWQQARLMGDGCPGAALVDLSDDLLEEVLIGDDAGEAAVLIDDRHQLDVLRSHFCDQRQQVL